MTVALRRDMINAHAIYKRLGTNWESPTPLGEDAWVFKGQQKAIIVSYDPDSEPGTEWVHASIAYANSWRLPSYSDLKEMHRAVFSDGYAYQCFVPTTEHVNIKANVLHLWGRLDGNSALPNFGYLGTI